MAETNRPERESPNRRVHRRIMLAPTPEEMDAVRQVTHVFVQAGRDCGADSQEIRNEVGSALERAFDHGVFGEEFTVPMLLDPDSPLIWAVVGPRDVFRLLLAEYGAAGRPGVLPDADREGLYATIVGRTLDELLGE